MKIAFLLPLLALLATPAFAATPATKLPANAQFSTVALAQAHCPGDTIAWSSMSKSKSYHLSKSRYFGKTKHGAYACKKDLAAAGFHAAKS
jgi:hypothetical protein